MVNFQQLENSYKGKKVFLTGHTGFKGAWMLKTLSLLGAEIKGYALEPQTPNALFHLIDGEKLCNSVIADLRDKERLQEEILSFQPDFVFHLAAQALVRLSYEIPAVTFEVNVIGTANVLDAVKLLQKKCSVLNSLEFLLPFPLLSVSSCVSLFWLTFFSHYISFLSFGP